MVSASFVIGSEWPMWYILPQKSSGLHIRIPYNSNLLVVHFFIYYFEVLLKIRKFHCRDIFSKIYWKWLFRAFSKISIRKFHSTPKYLNFEWHFFRVFFTQLTFGLLFRLLGWNSKLAWRNNNRSENPRRVQEPCFESN